MRQWRSPKSCLTLLRLFPGVPPWTFDLTDAKACQEFCGKEIGGEPMLCSVTSAGGLEVLYWLANFWREGARGRFYAATICIPLADVLFRIDIGATEHGTTGLRESTVLAITALNPELPTAWSDEFYDAYFSDHPLSLVRARLWEILSTLSLADGLHATAFRCNW